MVNFKSHLQVLARRIKRFQELQKNPRVSFESNDLLDVAQGEDSMYVMAYPDLVFPPYLIMEAKFLSKRMVKLFIESQTSNRRTLKKLDITKLDQYIIFFKRCEKFELALYNLFEKLSN